MRTKTTLPQRRVEFAVQVEFQVEVQPLDVVQEK